VKKPGYNLVKGRVKWRILLTIGVFLNFLIPAGECRRVKTTGGRFKPVSELRELVPVEFFKKAVQEAVAEGKFDTDGELDIKVEGKITPESLTIRVLAGDRWLAEVGIKVENSVSFTFRYDPDNPGPTPFQKLNERVPEVIQALTSSETQVMYSQGEMYYPSGWKPKESFSSLEECRKKHSYLRLFRQDITNLRPFAQVTRFGILVALRERGLGRLWYEKYIEPYLKECGFSVVSFKGTCWDDVNVDRFWRNRGFAKKMALQPYFGYSEEVQEFISFKKIFP